MAAVTTNQTFARRAKCSHIWRDSLRSKNKTQRRITRTEVTVGTQWQYIPANTNAGLWETSVKSLKYQQYHEYQHYGTVKEVNVYQANVRTTYNVWDSLSLDEPKEVKETECNMTRWQHTQKLVGDLWRRWKSELTKVSTKCFKKEKDGEYVFVNTANMQPAGKWYFGTMEKTQKV